MKTYGKQYLPLVDSVAATKGQPFFQPKPAINNPNDQYEQEADAVADKIMRMETPSLQTKTNNNSFFKPAPIAISSLQRQCAHCEEEEKMQRKEMNDAKSTADNNLEDYIGALSNGGQSLPNEVRNFYEPRFGYDFSNVKMHTDTVAAKSAQSINALAYTSGNNIVFNSGQYAPDTDSGKRLLGHELTHVIQQGKSNHKKDIQRLSVNPHGTYTQGICGEYEKFWIFELSNPAPEDGYIIQQVDMYEDYKACPARGYELAKPTSTFWEAWWLKKGGRRQHIHNQVGFTDRAALNSRPNQSGAHAAVGTIKFFKKSVTGDLGRENVITSDPSINWRPGNQGGVTLSGWLPSTGTAPSWWGNSVEGPVKRYATADWYCCGDVSKYWSTSSATP